MAAMNLAAVPVVASMGTLSSPVGPASCSTMGSTANLGGIRLNLVAAAPARRPLRSFVVLAEDKPNVLDGIKEQAEKVGDSVQGAFGGAQQKTDEAARESKNQFNKAGSQAKSTSGDLGEQAANLKDNVQARAEEAGQKVKSGIEDLQNKIQDAGESAKGNVEDASRKVQNK